MDLALVALSLPLVIPLALIVALIIKLDTPGPVLFSQERVGSRRRMIDGHLVWEVRMFRIFKFRSMYTNVDESLHKDHIRQFVESAIAEGSAAIAGHKLADDPRITRAGRLLRRTSIDELPQLINVLRGEMSLVGPRPVPEYEVQHYREDWHYTRLAATPGLTGYWQVKGRGRVMFQDMVRLDLEYIRKQSLRLDCAILLQTIPAVLAGKGAH
ncbi:MAG: sugar transferase [Chloroflexales bacterium]|nr:sugar transferase [Chloroflexales bacterium]